MFQVKLLARRLSIILFSLSAIVVNCNIDNSYSAIAQTENFQPLAIPQNDPLLPSDNIERELSPLEKKRIKAEIARLGTEAQKKLEQGQQKEAFKLWFRQLRLYRAISQLEEITTLGRVGSIAWQANLREELKVITQRLNDIYQELNWQNKLTQESKELLISLATSFKQVRHLDSAIAIYNRLLIQARQANDLQLEIKYLTTLGKLYLDKFDYVQAANIYEELLSIVNNSSARKNLDFYLNQLIKIYSYTKQPQQAILIKKQLINYYLSQKNNQQIGKLQISLGDDYQSVGETELAIKSYQEANILSESLQQLAITGEALDKLANIYQKQEQYLLAIQTYQKLLNVENRAYDSYGMIDTYEKLGKIYLIIEDDRQALLAFTEALKLAKSINYQIEYFTDLIYKIQNKNQ